VATASQIARRVRDRSTSIKEDRLTRDELIAQSDRFLAAWNAHDPSAIAELFATDATVRDAASPDVARGRDAIAGRAATIIGAFPRLQDRAHVDPHRGQPDGAGVALRGEAPG
jgi:hypothetical protein